MEYPEVSMLLLLNITSLLGLVWLLSSTTSSASLMTAVPEVPLVTVIKITNEKLKQDVNFPVRIMAQEGYRQDALIQPK